ncbi:GNAT family N-acetyltransferase [Sphaerisporangium sp. NPDC088356]|uniref:GNAT family N-acetyltransferase n=1 Tax=Sphaerisporangium sp. NPDC088356 TaxID=3154871 RepID=UPI003423B7D5
MNAIRAEGITTRRLDLLPLRVEHAQEMATVLSDPALHTFIGGAPDTPQALLARYQRLVAGSPDPAVGWLNWVIRLRDEACLTGTVQATISPSDHGPVAEIAWVVGTPWQRRGIATEAAQGLVTWLGRQPVQTVIAHIHPEHHASAAVATTLGLTPTHQRQGVEIRWRRRMRPMTPPSTGLDNFSPRHRLTQYGGQQPDARQSGRVPQHGHVAAEQGRGPCRPVPRLLSIGTCGFGGGMLGVGSAWRCTAGRCDHRRRTRRGPCRCDCWHATLIDGTAAAPEYYQRRRRVIYNALRYAVNQGRLKENPLDSEALMNEWAQPDVDVAVDPRSVGNPRQVTEALIACSYVGRRQGPRFVAFFACMYYAMLRLTEDSRLRRADCHLPQIGWGKLILKASAPEVGKEYTDNGELHDERGLKGRTKKAVRPVPIPPELVTQLREHINRFGVVSDGRLFRSESGRLVPKSTYSRLWKKVRELKLSPEQLASPLMRRPYDLRHAGVTWRL